MLRSRIQSNESAAIGNLKAIVGAEVAYNSAKGTYGDFVALTDETNGPAFLNGEWTDGIEKQGYLYNLTNATSTDFDATADPASENSGTRFFYADASGVIRYSTTGTATKDSPAIGETE